MGKINMRLVSLKWRFIVYFPICLLAAFIGAAVIGNANNHLQSWYISYHMKSFAASEKSPNQDAEVVEIEGNWPGRAVYYYSEEFRDRLGYFLVSNIQTILIPLWVAGCIGVTGIIFYNRELKKPIDLLLNASKEISRNKLDFEIKYDRQDEMGMLCKAFEEMRSALFKNNQQLWRSLEERKRLNAAFAHDLRTPLTVLQGYVDYLQKYVPAGQVSEEKLEEVLGRMSSQVARLTRYTYKMSDTQKLENVALSVQEVTALRLENVLRETGGLLCKEKEFVCLADLETQSISLDLELFLQMYENLLSNAVRYARETVWVECRQVRDMLELVVKDDGEGFSKEALKCAIEPFYREEKGQDSRHFGLGLYICGLICEKCGGQLRVDNWEKGGMVAAKISCKESENLGKS